MNKKFTKLMAALALLVFMTPSLAGWGQTVSENDVLWKEIFKGGTNSTTFSETNSWDDYIDPTTFVQNDASSLVYSSSNAMVTTSSGGSNMAGSHVWLKKQTTGYIQVAGIKLYNTTKIKVSWAQGSSNTAPITVSYTFDGGTTYANLSTNSSATAEFVSDELDVTGYTTINLRFTRSSNNNAARIDNLTLIATAVAPAGPSISINPTAAQPFTYVVGNGPSEEQVFEVTGSNLTSVITASVPSDCAFEITNDVTYGNTVTIGDGDNISVRMKADKSAGTYNAILTLSSVGADDVTVSLTGTVSNPTYAITLNQITGGTIAANFSVAEAGTTVTLSYSDLDDCYTFGGWTVLDGNADPITVTNNQFEMPASAVEVGGIFTMKTFTVNYSVNGTIVDDFTESVNCGSNAELWGEDYVGTYATIPTGYSFAGWTTNPAYTTVVASYEPEDDATLYAVFAKTVSGIPVENVVILDGEATGLTANILNTETTISENNFDYKAIGVKYCAVQSGATNAFETLHKTIIGGKDAAVCIYNSTAFGDGITKFEIYSNYGASTQVTVGVNFGTSQITSYDSNASNTWSQQLSTANTVYDASSALPEGAKYFCFGIAKDKNAQVQFRITYTTIGSTTKYYTLIKNVTDSLTMDNIYSTYLVNVEDGGVLTLTGNESNCTPDNLIIEDGGQLISDDVIEATIKKNITGASVWGHQDESYTPDGWYLISSPLNCETTGINPATATNEIKNMTTGDYDLYLFDPNADKEWVNFKGDNGNFGLINGHGYLYANANNVTLEFAGSLNFFDAESFSSLEEGYNLIGNPYAYNAYPNMNYYKMNNAHTGIMATVVDKANYVEPCTGIIVEKVGDDPMSFSFSKTAPTGGAKGGINVVLAETKRGAAKLDNAIVNFNEGSQLGKFYFGTQNANLYIPQGTEEYAIVSSNGQGEMPVNFRANEDGQYTLTVNPEGVEMNYLHLIDNMTGMDIDLLQTPSYSFNATTTDYESRFRLVFASNGASTGSASDETFAFYSDGNWIINNAGEATLQVVDLMGRILSSETVNGSVSKTINATTGIYMLRLINGENVKVQKVVVR